MQRLYGKLLFLFLNSAVNLKLLFKTKAIFLKTGKKCDFYERWNLRTQLFLSPTTALKRCSSRILFLAITSFYRFSNAILSTPTIYKQSLKCVYNPFPNNQYSNCSEKCWCSVMSSVTPCLVCLSTAWLLCSFIPTSHSQHCLPHYASKGLL